MSLQPNRELGPSNAILVVERIFPRPDQKKRQKGESENKRRFPAMRRSESKLMKEAPRHDQYH